MKNQTFKRIYITVGILFLFCVFIGTALLIYQVKNSIDNERTQSSSDLGALNLSMTNELSKLSLSAYLISKNSSLQDFELDSLKSTPLEAYNTLSQKNFEDTLEEKSFFNKLDNTFEVYFPALKTTIGTSGPSKILSKKKYINFGKWAYEYNNNEQVLSYYTNNLNDHGLLSVNENPYIVRTSIFPSQLLAQNLGVVNSVAISTTSGDYYTFNMYNIEKKLLYKQIGNLKNKTTSFLSINNFNLYVISTSYNNTGNFNLISIKNINSIFPNLVLSMGLFIGTLLFLGLLFIYVLFIIKSKIHQPLQEVTFGLKQYQQRNYDYQIHSNSDNEYRYIIDNFNLLGLQVKKLIQDVLDEQEQTKNAEIKQLELQLNPHFLYNSLSFIASAAKLNMKEEVIDMCYSLSDYYRYILSKKDKNNTLKMEIDALETYLKIFQLRSRRLSYGFNIDEKLMQQPFLPVLLQPLLENSIKYGIDDSDDYMTINILGEIHGDFFIISVIDNGKKISDAEITYINNVILTGKDSNHIGLLNISRRLRYHYGPAATLTIKKNHDKGAIVTLIIPLTKEDVNHESTYS